jgi:hypothetical protein
MARNIATIKAQIREEKNTHSELDDLKFAEEGGSKAGIGNAVAYDTAACINILEQLLDVAKDEIESSISKAGVGTVPWLRERILEFQKGDYVAFNSSTGKVEYAIIDTVKQILTRCSVTQDGNRLVKAKVAKSDPPEKLSDSEKTELEFYIKQIQFAGTQINVVSEDPDLLYVEAQVYYDGQYSESIQTSVITALQDYCKNLSSADNFNGEVELNAVEEAIYAVDGVKRVKLIEVSARSATTGFVSRNVIFKLSTGTNNLKYPTSSGYIIEEAETGNTFTDKITFIAA